MPISITLDTPTLYRDFRITPAIRYGLWSVGDKMVVCQDGAITSEIAMLDGARIGTIADSEIECGVHSLPILPILQKYVIADDLTLTLKLAPGRSLYRTQSTVENATHLYNYRGKLVLASTRTLTEDKYTQYVGEICTGPLPFDVRDLPIA